MTPTVVLFDIDGTLVSCGGAGKRAMQTAFRKLHGRDDVLDFPFGGLTDRAIVRSGLRALSADDGPESVARLIDCYLVHLRLQLPAASEYRVLPGVEPLLDALATLGDLALGLGTGNVEAGAREKLAHGGLWERFEFGGFGCDDEDRARLLAAGARRGAKRLGVEQRACRVVVIGDTPRDVAAAQAIGAECVAVTTGSYAQAELRDAGADSVLRDLTELDAIRRLVSR